MSSTPNPDLPRRNSSRLTRPSSPSASVHSRNGHDEEAHPATGTKTSSPPDPERTPTRTSPPQDARVLVERAAALARPPAAVAEDQELLSCVTFALGAERYAIDAAYVREVAYVKEFTPLPTVPPFIVGIFNLRGQIVSVLDPKRLLNLPPTGISDFYTVLVLRSPQMEFGLLADRVLGAADIRPRDLQPGLPALGPAHTQYLKGISPDRLILLDAAKLLEDSGLIIYDEV